MRAVWSFWSKPFRAKTSLSWLSPRHHLLSWVLSVETARRHFDELCLYTDSDGAKLLIDRLGLQFDWLSTSLDDIDSYDASVWSLGKLHAYRSEQAPFIHIDSDAFLWKPLADSLLSADVIAQNSEYFPFDGSFVYRPEVLESAINERGGWLPVEWTWCRSVFTGVQKGIACGIFGGHNLTFIRYYAELALKVLNDNSGLLEALPDKSGLSILLEQFLLAACVNYHQHRVGSPFKDLAVRLLFDSFEDAYFEAHSVGYTHLLGTTKKDPAIMLRLENRVAKEYPELYERCLRAS